MKNKSKINFNLFISGRFISMLGNYMQSIAIPLYILEITSSGLYTGAFMLSKSIPVILFSLFAGYLGDNLNRKKIMITFDILSGILTLSVPIIINFSDLSISLLFIIQFMLSIFSSIFNSSTASMLGDIIDEKYIEKASAKQGMIDTVATVLGPILGGILYGYGGISFVFIINGISFLISALSEMFIYYSPNNTNSKNKLSIKQFIKNNAKIFAFAKEYKGLKNLFILIMFLNFIGGPIYSLIFPYAYQTTIPFTSQAYGVLNSIMMFGVFISNFLIDTKLSRVSAFKLIRLSTIGIISIFALYFIGFQSVSAYNISITISFVIFSILNLLFGIILALFNTPTVIISQKHIPSSIRATFWSAVYFSGQLVVPVSTMIGGWIIDNLDVSIYFGVFFVLGILCIKFINVEFNIDDKDIYNKT